MKRILAIVISVFLSAAILAGCTNTANNDIIDDMTGDTDNRGEKYTLRLGVYQTHNASEGKAKFSSTYAAVICDEDGTIVDCAFDATEDTLSVDGGIVETGGEYISKRAQGNDYSMKNASDIGLEWFEQADHFAQFIDGFALSDTADIDGGEADLMAGCTIDISGFKGALEKAAANESDAVEFYSEKAPVASLAVVSHSEGSKDAAADTDGIASLSSTYAAVAKNGSAVAAANIEATETKVYFDNAGLIIQTDQGPGKREEGDSYGMKASSGIGLEWHEQVKNFEKYIVGMTGEQISHIEMTDSRPASPDLLSGCTIKIDDFVRAVSNAMKTEIKQ